MSRPDPTQAHNPESRPGQDETVDENALPAHPSEDELALFAAGRLPESEAAEIEKHIESCRECIVTINEVRMNVVTRVDTINHTNVGTVIDEGVSGDSNESVDQSIETTPAMGDEAQAEPNAFGDYELITEIARGGMGVVYEARQRSLNRVVALKMIKSGEFADQEQVDRFYKEAEAAANLDHPGIVPVHEVGEINGQHFFTMGFVDGESLADRLREGPLSPKVAALYAMEIAEAVAYAHSKGVIHRDLKPSNVLITKEGALRITDFGLAKRIEDDNELTATGQVMGTPSYMPPEQAEGRVSEIGPAADVYSIGATLYCMLVGRPPFQAANVIETLQQVLEKDPVSLSSQNLSIPADLETLCLKCLEKQPTKRFLSAQGLVDELTRFHNGEPIQARPIGSVERVWRWCKRKPIAAGLLFSVIMLGVGGVTFSTLLFLANRDNAIARVDRLLGASPATIPLILDELDRTAGTVESRLRELDSKEGLEPSERLRVSMALLPYDSSQLDELKQQLHECTYDELEVLLDRIRDHGGDSIVKELWPAFRDQKLTKKQRFRTGVALAALDPDSEQWAGDDFRFLVNSMLAVNTVYQPAIRKSLAPMGTKLVGAVKEAYEAAKPDTLVDESSANAVIAFATDNTVLLSDLSSLATPKQHSIVFPAIAQQAASDESVVEKFIEITKLQPGPDDDEFTRIKLGKKRAGSAINLVLLDRPDDALEVLRVQEDPESMTQFIHECKERGITVDHLLDLLKRASSVSERYGVLLALGEFELADISEDIRAGLVDSLKELYSSDPNSGIHGASGWLLRRWGYDDAVRDVDETPIPFDETFTRDWFVIGVDVQQLGESLEPNHSKRIYFTMIVIRPAEFMMGSPDDEKDRLPDEQLHRVELTRPIAVSDREVTWEQFNGFDESSHHDEWEHQFGRKLGVSEPTFGVSWFDVVGYCRWLSEQVGVSESDQCYDSGPLSENSSPPAYARGWVELPDTTQWRVNLDGRGFRLPTQAEWEHACRSATATAYSSGSDRSHLGSYCWSFENSGEWSHAGALLRPNLRGLYDMHGNMHEWCHDWFAIDVSPGKDPVGPDSGSGRTRRGGNWYSAAHQCRSGGRFSIRPTDRNSMTGFRVAIVPQARQRGGEASEKGR